MNDVKIIADLREAEQSRVALLENGKLAEIFIDFNFNDDSAAIREGDIFKARIETLVPSISAAFLKLSSLKLSPRKNLNFIGAGNSFMYVNEAENPSSVKSGREIIVQVVKTARKNKAPRVSPKLSIPGRWLVLVPNSSETGISKRIYDPSERKRLKFFADTLKPELNGCGVIIRTAAQGIPEEYLKEDFKSLLELWRDISEKAKESPAPCLLYRDMGTLGRVLRDEVSGKIDQIVVDTPEEFETAKIFVERFYPDEKPDVQLYEGAAPVFDYFGIEDEIRKAIDRKVWLKSGAYLVIDQTEAMTVIDVNTGKFTSAPDMRHTVLAANKEAAEEIARQLRLRAVGGIIVVDFVDMEFESDKNELLRHFQNFLSHDRMKPKIFSLTQLGLVELTRKRERPDLKSVLTRSCPVCVDNGFIECEENIAMSIKRFIRKITSSNNAEAFLLQTDKYSAAYINSKHIDRWQEEFGRKIFIAGMNDFPRGKFRLEFQGSIENAKNIINQ